VQLRQPRRVHFAVFHHGTFANVVIRTSHGSVTAAATADTFIPIRQLDRMNSEPLMKPRHSSKKLRRGVTAPVKRRISLRFPN
jgi:hypothetical protein